MILSPGGVNYIVKVYKLLFLSYFMVKLYDIVFKVPIDDAREIVDIKSVSPVVPRVGERIFDAENGVYLVDDIRYRVKSLNKRKLARIDEIAVWLRFEER